MTKGIFPLWVDDEEIKEIKAKAEKENLSASKFILKKVDEAPNLVLGNWWDDPNKIRKIAKEVAKQMRKK